MEDNPSSAASSDRNGLRQKALLQLEGQKGQGGAAVPDNPALARQLVQELEVHQVELQLQNEQLLETQRELETSRNTYFRLYDSAPVAYFTLDADGLITGCNLAAGQLLGYERRHLVGHGFLKFVLKSDRQAFYAFFSRLRSAAAKCTCQVGVLPRDGSPRYVRMEGIGPEGEQAGVSYLLTAMDLTEQLQAQAQLQAREALLREAEAVAQTGSYEANLSTGTYRFSDGLYRLFGEAPGSLVPTLDWIDARSHPEDAANARSILGRAATDKQPYAYTRRIRRRDGAWRVVAAQGKVVCDEAGNAIKLIGIVQDITEREKSAQQLAEEHRRLKEAQAIGQVGSFEWDAATDTIYWSDELYRIHGLEPQSEVINLERVLSFVHPGDVPDTVAQITRCRREPSGVNITHRIRRADGQVRVVRRHLQSFADPQGKVTHLSGTVQDITRQQQAEAELQLAYDAVEATHLGYWDLDLRLNDTLKRSLRHDQLFGYTELQEHWNVEIAKRHVLPEDHQAFDEAFSRAFGTGKLECEVRVRWADGSTHWVAVRGQFYFDEGGNPVRGVGVNYDSTAQKNAEQEIHRLKDEIARKATDKYLTLFNSIDQGFCIIEMLFDEEREPVDYRFLEANPVFEKQTGLRNAVGNTMKELQPAHEAYWFRIYGEIARTREPKRFEQRAGHLAGGVWYEVFAFPFGNPEEAQVAVLFNDITERKRQEGRQRYLLGLSEVLRTLSHPDEVLREALKTVGEFLDLDRVIYNEIDPAVTRYTVRVNYVRDGFASRVGIYPIDPFNETVKNLRLGQTFIVHNADDEQFSEAARDIHRRMNVGAYVVVPLLKHGRWVCNLVAHYCKPRNWTKPEITVLEETAERIWASLERANAEEALRQSEGRFRSLVTATSDTVYKMSADWQVMHILEGKRFLADTRNENNTWMENYIPEPERPRVAGAIAEAIRHKRMFELEHQVIDAAGHLAWAYSRAVPQLDEKGEITGWFGAASNITLRKQAEAQLREFAALLEKQVAGRTRELQESRDLLQSVFDTSLLSISVLEAVRDESGRIEDFRIKMVNQNILRATNRTDLTGTLFAQAFPGTRSVGLFDRMQQVMETGQPADMEYHYSYDGINKWYSSLFARLEDGLVLTTLDITQFKRLEAENIRIRLEQQQALLHAILEAQEEERRRISESLHNGVGQLLYATKLSLAGLEPDAPAARQRQGAEALQKTDALLTEAIVETRRVSHELVPILLKEFGLKQAIGEFCNRFAGTGIRLECHCFPERLPALLETAIYRISQELVNNIVKHSGATRAVVEVSKDQAFVYLDVQDNGRGMAREDGTGAYPSGKGIGLRTIRDRVKLLGGTIEIDSEPGHRTEIFICLPLLPGNGPALPG